MLFDRKTVFEGFARHDARKADPRNAIHLVREYQAVPVNGCCLRQGVGDPHNGFPSLFKSNQGGGQCAINCDGLV